MILVGGEVLIDFIQVPQKEGLPIYQANPGGSPYNCAAALGLQGCEVAFMTPISTDSLGDLLHSRLVEANVTALGARVAHPTTLAVVSFSDGQPTYQFYREGTADRQITLDALSAATPANARAFQIGSLGLTSGADAEVWAAFYARLADRGLLMSLDPNIRASFISDRPGYLARLERLLNLSSVVKLSDEDLEWIADIPDASQQALIEQAEAMAKRAGLRLLVLTLGADGAVAFFAGQRLIVAPQPLAVMGDTVGAGDTFMATILAELDRREALSPAGLAALSPEQVKDALDTAAKAAGINCGRHGCNPPTLAELQAG